MRTVRICTFLVFLLSLLAAVVSNAGATAASTTVGWTPAQAAAKVKATYTTVDKKAYAFAKAHNYASAMAYALHSAKPTTVTCKGVGEAAGGEYSRFHCTARVQGVSRIPPDYVLYTATKKLTVTVPFRVLAGWR